VIDRKEQKVRDRIVYLLLIVGTVEMIATLGSIWRWIGIALVVAAVLFVLWNFSQFLRENSQVNQEF
jgi:hypothetical protein